MSPDGATVYVIAGYSRQFCAIDAVQHLVAGCMTVSNLQCTQFSNGDQPGCLRALAITPDGSRAYVAIGLNAQGTNGHVGVIDIASMSLVDTITVGTSPAAVAIGP